MTTSKLPGWTILRNHWYFENLFYSLPTPSSPAPGTPPQATARSPTSPARIWPGRRRRVARTRRQKKLHPVGHRRRTTAEIAKLVSDAVGKPIAVVQVPVEGLVQGMVGSGVPDVIARVFASFDTNTAQGRVADVTGDYKKLTSNDNTPFTSWLAKNKQAFLGNQYLSTKGPQPGPFFPCPLSIWALLTPPEGINQCAEELHGGMGILGARQ